MAQRQSVVPVCFLVPEATPGHPDERRIQQAEEARLQSQRLRIADMWGQLPFATDMVHDGGSQLLQAIKEDMPTDPWNPVQVKLWNPVPVDHMSGS